MLTLLWIFIKRLACPNLPSLPQQHCSLKVFKISRSVLLVVCLARLKPFGVSSLQQTVFAGGYQTRRMGTFTGTTEDVSATSANPLLQTFSKNFGIPPFADIDTSHYTEAFQAAFVEHEAELKSIADNKEEPSFENTLLAFDRSGSLLTKVGKVYYNLGSSLCPPGQRNFRGAAVAYGSTNLFYLRRI